ncbi:MAG: OmpA family protein [Gammaproteobacteria bacterium]|nr:OmpA family protein [Gammaproteobacteria bacterium]MDE2345877.1 OmpA family protein [Gammaproteobacteria bacterium]
MSEAPTQHPGALLLRGLGFVLLAAAAGCASHATRPEFPLAVSSKQSENSQGVCVQIGITPADGKLPCNQLAQPDVKHHVEPLPLDEFGYLFPALKPEAEPAAASAAVKAQPAASAKPNAGTAAAPLIVAAKVPVAQAAPMVSAPPVAASVAPVSAAPLPLAVSTATAAKPPASTLPSPAAPAQAAHYMTKNLRFTTQKAFKLNSAHLARGNRRQILRFIDSLENYRGIERIRITGHTDKSGPAGFNHWLSGMRAKSAELLLLSLGADPRTIQMRGVGSSEPRPHAHSASANRYVDIEVTVRVPAQ